MEAGRAFSAVPDGGTSMGARIRGFDDRLRRSMARARTDKQPVCLLIADVDRFKTFNDTYGHRSGDLVLRLVARL